VMTISNPTLDLTWERQIDGSKKTERKSSREANRGRRGLSQHASTLPVGAPSDTTDSAKKNEVSGGSQILIWAAGRSFWEERRPNSRDHRSRSSHRECPERKAARLTGKSSTRSILETQYLEGANVKREVKREEDREQIQKGFEKAGSTLSGSARFGHQRDKKREEGL